MKKRIKKIVISYIRSDGIDISLLIIILFILIIFKYYYKTTYNIFDFTIFFSTFIALLITICTKTLKKLLLNHVEDNQKLTDDYDMLIKQYKNKMITYDNSSALKLNLDKIKKRQSLHITVPVICDFKLHNPMIIQDSQSMYKLPSILINNYDKIMKAHSTSNIYNSLTIRVDDWYIENNIFVMKTSRTNYFNTLITNRAMDYLWADGLTVRHLFEYKQYLNILKESALSNHLGFNCFVLTSDDYIIFIKRRNKLSTAKRTYGCSVSAVLKTQYALNDNGNFTENGLINGVLHELEKELNIEKEMIKNLSVEENLIAAYRDVVEGGKPQLLFFVKTFKSKDVIQRSLKHQTWLEKKFNLKDGKKLIGIKISDLSQICILPDRIVHEAYSFKMSPSAVASLILLIEYLKEKNNNENN